MSRRKRLICSLHWSVGSERGQPAQGNHADLLHGQPALYREVVQMASQGNLRTGAEHRSANRRGAQTYGAEHVDDVHVRLKATLASSLRHLRKPSAVDNVHVEHVDDVELVRPKRKCEFHA